MMDTNKTSKDAEMDFFERYLQELETFLPKSERDAVTAELRSKLQESLRQRQSASPGDSTQDLQVEVLAELGPPHLLAETHVPRPRVLFGPRLYPPFFRTLKIAIAILVALSALGVYLDFASSQSLLSLGPSLLAAFTRILSGSLVIVGISVLVFALIERTASESPDAEEKWDPRTLPEMGDPDKISLGDRVSSIAFLVVALIVVNLFRDRLGAHATWDGESGWVPLLGAGFASWLWLLNLALALDLLVNFLVLIRWRWTWPLRWANLAVHGLYVIWLGLLVSHPPLIAADPEWMVQNGWSAEVAAKYQEFIASDFAHWIDRNLKFGFWLACGAWGYSFIRLVWRLFSRS